MYTLRAKALRGSVWLGRFTPTPHFTHIPARRNLSGCLSGGLERRIQQRLCAIGHNIVNDK